MIGIESPSPAAARLDARRRPGAVVGRHAVPAVVEEGRPGDQRRQRLPAGRRARQPVRLRRVPGVAASPAARVRRRDRQGDRQLRRPVRALCRVALSRRSVRRLLGDAQRRHGGARRRGLVRLGDRRRAGGGGGVHPRGGRAHPRRRADPAAPRRRPPRPTTTSRCAGGPRSPSCGTRCAPRSSARSPPSSIRSTAWNGRRTVGSVHRIIAAADLRPELIAAVERGMQRVEARATQE